MTNSDCASITWFNEYLKSKGCKNFNMGSFEIWSKDGKEMRIPNNFKPRKQNCKIRIESLGLSYEEFVKAFENSKCY